MIVFGNAQDPSKEANNHQLAAMTSTYSRIIIPLCITAGVCLRSATASESFRIQVLPELVHYLLWRNVRLLPASDSQRGKGSSVKS